MTCFTCRQGIEWPFTLRSEPANLPVVFAAISGEGLEESKLYSDRVLRRSKQDGRIERRSDPASVWRQVSTNDGLRRSRQATGPPRQCHRTYRRRDAKSQFSPWPPEPRKWVIPTIRFIPATHCRRPKKSKTIPVTVRDRAIPSLFATWRRVKDDAAIQYNIVRVNGKRSVYCPLLREPGENTIAVVDRINEGSGNRDPKDEGAR